MPTIHLRGHQARKGKPIGQKAKPRSDVDAVKIRTGRKWRRLSAQIKRERPLCQRCEEEGRLTPSAEVHHVVKIRTNPNLAYDPDNLRALCRPCHEIEEHNSK